MLYIFVFYLLQSVYTSIHTSVDQASLCYIFIIFFTLQ